MKSRLDTLKFGIAGGIVSVASVLLFELFLIVNYLGYYNSLMANAYGVAGISGIGVFRIIFVSVFLSFFIGGALTWLFAWIYNNMPSFKFK
jgi:hypothetical protein|tara:strand:+ start:329 stop:601 length:273 start_codon:yes stop_codon:yes gene_type:complete